MNLTSTAAIAKLLKDHRLQAPNPQQLGVFKQISDFILLAKFQHALPIIIGISGAQGSGKTILSQILRCILEIDHQQTTLCLSLDDLYLTRKERQQLADERHPLFITRGVPGTHDTSLACSLLEILRSGANEQLLLPKFDKRYDDRLAQEKWQAVQLPVDVILFEGWCVGAKPLPSAVLDTPINELEKNDDQDGSWRQAVNQYLKGPYQTLFHFIDKQIFIQVPSFAMVKPNRLKQEKLLEKLTGSVGLRDDEIDRFIQHYQRISEDMLGTMPHRADLLLSVNRYHQYIRSV